MRGSESTWRRSIAALPWAAPSLASLALLRVPGFDLLDYHACLALAPVCGMAAAHGVLQRRKAWAWGALLGGPLLIYAVAAAFVPNCAPGTGVLIYLLGPCGSALVGACLGLIARALSPRRPRLVAWLIALLSLVPGVAHFLTAPQVFGYHGLIGWVGGALYEDDLGPHATWAWFRLIDTAAWLALAAWALEATGTGPSDDDGDGGGGGGGARALRLLGRSPRARVAAVVAATAVIVGQLLGGTLGWRVTQGQIARSLDGRIDLHLRGGPSPDVRVHMATRAGWERRAAFVAEDVAVRWRELRAWFGEAPQGRIDVFLYPDAAHKRRWMGAARVEMAKPWLRQVHMVWPGFGASVTRHELAHVFAGQRAPPPFRVPMRGGVWPDAVLIEGVAVAAEWPVRGGLDPHQWSAAMRRLDLAPPLGRLLAPTGFFSQSSARAYTLAGSFVRWLRDTHGAEALRRLMALGDPAAATGVPLATLITRWERHVDAQVLRPVDLERARARFEPSALFFRPCSLEIGRCRERARRAWQAGDDAAALESWEGLWERVRDAAAGRPVGLDVALAVAVARAKVERRTDAMTLLTDTLSTGGAARGGARRVGSLTRLQRARVSRLRGDIRAGHDTEGALADWRQAATAPLSDAALRLLRVKLALGTLSPAGGRFVWEGLSATGPDVSFRRALTRLQRSHGAHPLVRYLAARRRSLGSREAVRELKALAVELRGSYPLIARECWRLVARFAARQGRCEAVASAAAKAGSEHSDVRAWRAALGERCAMMADSVSPRIYRVR